MNASLDATIHRTPKANEVQFDRRFNAPGDEVWRHVTEAELLSKWMGGAITKLELVVGGEIVIEMTQVGATVRCKVLEVDPGRLLFFTWDTSAWGNIPELFGTTMRLEVQPDGDGSRLLLTHALPYRLGREHLMAAAWHDHLDELEKLIDGAGDDFVIKEGRLVEMTMGYLDKDTAQRRAEYEHLLDLGHLSTAS